MKYFPFHIGDYVKKTAHLSHLEDLAYLRMIIMYYSTGEPLPKDVKKIARLTRMSGHENEVNLILSDFFQEEEDGYHCSRCDKEIIKYSEKVSRAKTAIKSRWDTKRMTNKIPTKNQEPITNNQIKEKESTKEKIFSPLKEIQKHQVRDQIAKDWLQIRKAKKAPLTRTALNRILAEIRLANISVEQALTICIERNWVGFKPEWLKIAPYEHKNSQACNTIPNTEKVQWRFKEASILAKGEELNIPRLRVMGKWENIKAYRARLDKFLKEQESDKNL